GMLGVYGAAAWSRISPPVRALLIFTLSSAFLWLALFSLGEFEGPRFYVPLSPLVLMLAALAFRDLIEWATSLKRASIIGAVVLAAAMLLPGVFKIAFLLSGDRPDPFRAALGELIQSHLPEDAIILSDVPWAVAWYGDRTSVWIPRSLPAIHV